MLPMRSLLLLSACSLLITGCLKFREQQTPSVQTVQFDAQSGQTKGEQWFAIGALSGVNDSKANGVATAHYLANGTFVVGIQLNILPAPAGNQYEAWLEAAEGQPALALGVLKSAKGDARHQLQFETSKDLRGDSLKILVRKRKLSDLTGSGEPIATGILKVQKR